MNPLNIGIYIYDNAEVLDFSGPFEVFTTATRVAKTPHFNTFLISESGQTVTARAGYQVVPQHSFADHPPIDVLIIVGGVHTEEMTKPEVLTWVNAQAKTAQLVASVCTGAFILAAAEVLSDQNVTTHWDDIADLRAQFPTLNVIENKRWVDEGTLITSGGISAGIDMSLHIVGRLTSLELAHKTARQMEFDWTGN
jgi:transcriptional regulator GlxA family with amidase domain